MQLPLTTKKYLSLGMTKAAVRGLLGPPTDWSRRTRDYPEPMIWKYYDLELTFWTTKKRTPYPGPPLIRVRDLSLPENQTCAEATTSDG